MTKATLITKGGLGNIVVTHIRLVDHGRCKYAQYESAPFVNYVPKGARRQRGFVQCYAPYILILEGWQDIESDSLFGEAETSSVPGVTVSQGRYSSFDEGWVKDFERGKVFKNVIADYRNVNTHDPL